MDHPKRRHIQTIAGKAAADTLHKALLHRAPGNRLSGAPNDRTLSRAALRSSGLLRAARELLAQPWQRKVVQARLCPTFPVRRKPTPARQRDEAQLKPTHPPDFKDKDKVKNKIEASQDEHKAPTGAGT